MWRFGVFAQKSSIIKFSTLKAVKDAFRHTDRRAIHNRFLSNEASSVRLDHDQPIREVFSLDDFGSLSISRSSSNETISSFESDQTFLEHLLRNDSLSYFANVHIPTTVDSKELGGTSDVLGYDQAVELLSEGIDVTSILDEFEALNQESYLREQKPSSSQSVEAEDVVELPFLIPSIDSSHKSKTRSFLSERKRRERRLNLSTTTIEEETPQLSVENMKNIGELMFPESLPKESFTSQWNGNQPLSVAEKVEETSETDRFMEFSLDIIEGIAADGSMDELRAELKGVEWPDWLFTGDRNITAQINRVLRFIVNNSSSYDEASSYINHFARSHIKAIIPEDVKLQLVKRFAETTTESSAIINKLEEVSNISLSRELITNRQLIRTSLGNLYELVLKRDLTTAPSIFSSCLKHGFDNNAEVFLNSYAKIAFKSKLDFLKCFNEWKKLSIKYGTISGIDSFWLMVVSGSEGNNMAKQINCLLSHSKKSEHPFSTIAHLICSFIQLNQLPKAMEVFRTVSVSGRHFRDSLDRFTETCDLESIERLAELVQNGIIAERRRGTTNTSEETEEVNLLDSNFHAVLKKFYGVGDQKRKTFVNKNLKKKNHKVDEEQLHMLCSSLMDSWIKCAEKKSDGLSAKRLSAWCIKNRIEIKPTLRNRINRFV